MSNKWETAKIKKSDFAADWKKYLASEITRYDIAKKYKINYYTVIDIAKRFELPMKPRGARTIDTDKFIEIYNKFANRQISRDECAKQMGVSRPTLYKWMLQLGDQRFKLEGLPFLFDEEKWREENL